MDRVLNLPNALGSSSSSSERLNHFHRFGTADCGSRPRTACGFHRGYPAVYGSHSLGPKHG
eukprot:7373937-Alexandrium_andersonii.AAC.1